MSELTTLARPYAIAVYKRARETGSAGRWAEALGFLRLVLADPQIRQAASNPKVKREAFTAAFLDLCQGRLEPEMENFVRLLIQNHRLDLVGHITDIYRQYQADDEGYIEVDVRTAYALEDHEWESLAAVLGQVLRKEARLRVFIDSDLIGGVHIRAGDRVIDASVRGQLERLAKRLWN